ncbi:lipase family protein [Mycolicibacterium grossiae]|nr:lipase family protein [Mycolicibacterium grossiae]
MSMRTVVACLAAVAAIVSGCSTSTPAESADPSGAMPLPGDFGGDAAGSLLSAHTLPTLDRRLSAASSVAARITYLSTSGIDGSVREVSGTVFTPAGTPPDGGWPVIAYGHPTTGTRSECAPSLDPMLLGMSQTVTGLVKAGYVVTVADYQGLGTDGYHPYLDATTEGYNLIDSVRAARKLTAGASTRWAAFGGSQGGQAAWAANELAGGYAPELQLVGSASYSAPLSLEGFVDGAVEGTLTSEQRLALLQVLGSLAAASPDFPLDDYRSGLAKEKWDVFEACKGPQAEERDRLANDLTADDVRPASPGAAETLRARLTAMSLPKVPATAPLLIVYGGQDQLVPPVWTDRALEEACRKGDVIQIEFQPDRGHADVDGGSAFPWINQRFAGEPVRNDCPAFLGPVEPPETEQVPQ